MMTMSGRHFIAFWKVGKWLLSRSHHACGSGSSRPVGQQQPLDGVVRLFVAWVCCLPCRVDAALETTHRWTRGPWSEIRDSVESVVASGKLWRGRKESQGIEGLLVDGDDDLNDGRGDANNVDIDMRLVVFFEY